MKKIFVVCLMLAGVTATAQKISLSKVPTPVKIAFAKSFPGINFVRWEKEKENYEAGFKQGDKTMSALFNSKGEWLKTETGIKVSELPAAIKKYIIEKYKGQKIKEAAIIKKSNGETNYEAEVRKTNRDLGSTIKDIQKALSSKIALPQGYHIEYGGSYAD